MSGADSVLGHQTDLGGSDGSEAWTNVLGGLLTDAVLFLDSDISTFVLSPASSIDGSHHNAMSGESTHGSNIVTPPRLRRGRDEMLRRTYAEFSSHRYFRNHVGNGANLDFDHFAGQSRHYDTVMVAADCDIVAVRTKNRAGRSVNGRDPFWYLMLPGGDDAGTDNRDESHRQDDDSGGSEQGAVAGSERNARAALHNSAESDQRTVVHRCYRDGNHGSKEGNLSAAAVDAQDQNAVGGEVDGVLHPQVDSQDEASEDDDAGDESRPSANNKKVYSVGQDILRRFQMAYANEESSSGGVTISSMCEQYHVTMRMFLLLMTQQIDDFAEKDMITFCLSQCVQVGVPGFTKTRNDLTKEKRNACLEVEKTMAAMCSRKRVYIRNQLRLHCLVKFALGNFGNLMKHTYNCDREPDAMYKILEQLVVHPLCNQRGCLRTLELLFVQMESGDHREALLKQIDSVVDNNMANDEAALPGRSFMKFLKESNDSGAILLSEIRANLLVREYTAVVAKKCIGHGVGEQVVINIHCNGVFADQRALIFKDICSTLKTFVNKYSEKSTGGGVDEAGKSPDLVSKLVQKVVRELKRVQKNHHLLAEEDIETLNTACSKTQDVLKRPRLE